MRHGKTMAGKLSGATSATIALPLTPPFRWKRSPKPPVRRDRRAKPRVARGRDEQGLARRVAAGAAALPDHAWLDRVVRGRAWIPLLGVLLVGIVAAQVEILKLGANLGRALEQTSTLTTQNEQLRGTVAQLSDDQRIERLAGSMGLVLPPPGAVGYLSANPAGDVSGALANIHAPDSAAFVAMTPHNGALVTGPNASTLPPPLGAPPPPTGTTSTSTTTPSATVAAPTAGTTAASPTTAASGTTTTSTTAPAATTISQTPAATTAPVSSPPPASTSPSAAAPATTTLSQSSAATATGAAAIQPSGTSQPTGGG